MSGRILPEFPDLSYREVIVVPYRFFYKVKNNTVWIELKALGYDLQRVAERAAAVLGMEVAKIFSPGRQDCKVKERSLVCFWAARELGMSLSFSVIKVKFTGETADDVMVYKRQMP